MEHGLEERGIDRWRLDQALLPFPLVDALYGKLGIPHPFAQKHFGTHLYIDPSGAFSQCRNPRSKLYVVKHKNDKAEAARSSAICRERQVLDNRI